MRFYKKNGSEQVSQKKRFYKFKKLCLKLRYGSSGFFFRKSVTFEWIYIRFLRPLVKKLLKAKYSKKKQKKSWIQLQTNFPVSKKSKNSRMGKGKGRFFRWVIRITKNTIFLELNIICNYILKSFIKKINYKFITKLYFFSKLNSYPNWANSKFLFYYTNRFKKHRSTKYL